MTKLTEDQRWSIRDIKYEFECYRDDEIEELKDDLKDEIYILREDLKDDIKEVKLKYKNQIKEKIEVLKETWK